MCFVWYSSQYPLQVVFVCVRRSLLFSIYIDCSAYSLLTILLIFFSDFPSPLDYTTSAADGL